LLDDSHPLSLEHGIACVRGVRCVVALQHVRVEWLFRPTLDDAEALVPGRRRDPAENPLRLP
jgi:hypothetical protein